MEDGSVIISLNWCQDQTLHLIKAPGAKDEKMTILCVIHFYF